MDWSAFGVALGAGLVAVWAAAEAMRSADAAEAQVEIARQAAAAQREGAAAMGLDAVTTAAKGRLV
jgi:hypothetical protein